MNWKTAPFVSGDLALIERVLENLIENAIKFTPSGGTVQVGLAATETGVTIGVADTGPGIAPDHLPYVFDRFYQGDQRACSRNKGAGLGLAIAQRILLLHDSTITVDSTPGAGTCFRFRLAASTSLEG